MKRRLILAVLLAGVMLVSACSGSDGSHTANYAPMVSPAAVADSWGGTAAWNDETVALQNVLAFSRTESAGSGQMITTQPSATLPAASRPRHDTAPAAETTVQQTRHIIQTAWTELDTEYFYDVIEELRQIPFASGGYVEAEQLRTHGRRIFTMTMRIPSAYFQDVLREVEDLANVRASNQSAEDVTDRFYDITARLATRRIEEERLLALIEESETVRELLDLESRLSNTRLQIEMYSTQINNLAGRIAYSTIYITLFDTAQLPPPVRASLGERIGGAFGDSIDSTVTTGQNFVVFMAGAIIPLLVWGAIGFGVYKVVKRLRKKLVVNSGTN